MKLSSLNNSQENNGTEGMQTFDTLPIMWI